MTADGFRNLALLVLGLVLVFDVGLYNYYRGSVLTPYHGGPVSAAAHHLALSDAAILPDGGVRFTITLDGGTPAVPAHVMKVEVMSAERKNLAIWDWRSLSALPASAIVNAFRYNRVQVRALWARGWNGRERDRHASPAGERDATHVGRAPAGH